MNARVDRTPGARQPDPRNTLRDLASEIAAETGSNFALAFAALGVVVIAGLRAVDADATQDLLLALAQHTGDGPLQDAGGVKAALARISVSFEHGGSI